MTIELRSKGFVVNHKKVQRLMQVSGRKAIYPQKKTTIRNPQHKVFKYLLRGLKIERPNQVWEVDITYIKVKNGFVYLTCLIDVFSRKIMGWSLSTFLDTASCLEALNNALQHGKPDIINSDQGCQFTSVGWVETLVKHGIFISMDGKGRWADNVYVERLWRTIKQEIVRLYRFDSVDQARLVLGDFINFYNTKRFHQSLNYHTPDAIYELKAIPTKQQLFEQFTLKHAHTKLEVCATPK
jgi:putative transposase